MHRYTPAGGLPALRQAIAGTRHRDSGFELQRRQVLVTNGGKQAVTAAFAALLDPGDEVLLPGAVLDHVPGGHRARRRRPVSDRHHTRRPASASPSTSSRRRGPTHQGPAVLSPGQPDRRGLPEGRVEAIGRWAVEHDLWVITDEIYQHLLYGGAHRASMPTRRARPRRSLRRPQRRRQDLCDDRLARRLDDRAERRDHGGDNLQSHSTSQRGQRRPGGGPRRSERRPVGGAMMRAAFDAGQDDVRMLSEIPGVSARSRRARSTAIP